MSLRKKTIAGIGWNSVGNIFRQAFQLLTLIIMARLLSPEEFGTFAILMVFVGFFNIFAMMGTSQVIVYLDSPSQRMLSTIFYFNIGTGLFLSSVLYIASEYIESFFKIPDLAKYLQLIGISFILLTLSLVQKSLLEKALHFKKVVIIETLALGVASLAAIIAAFYEIGIYSLILMVLLNNALLAIGLWVSTHWKPSLTFHIDDLKIIWNYSANLTGFSFINYFSRNADQFLIGKFLGSSSLGIYSIAYKIMLYPLDNISRVIVRVLFPAFSEIKNDNVRFKAAYLKAISFIALITFPIMMGLLATADNFVALTLGDKWSEMALILMILAPIGMMQSIVTTVGSIYTAKGTTGLMFKIGAVNAIVTVLSFIVGLPFGLEGVAIFYAIANVLMLYPNLKVSWDQIELRITDGLKTLLPFLLSSLLMSIIIYSLGIYFKNTDANLLIVLILQIAIGILFYTFLLLTVYRTNMKKLIKEVTSKRNLSLR